MKDNPFQPERRGWKEFAPFGTSRNTVISLEKARCPTLVLPVAADSV